MPTNKHDRTLRKCRLCSNKEGGWIDMKKHLLEEHTLNERLEGLTENIDPGPSVR